MSSTTGYLCFGTMVPSDLSYDFGDQFGDQYDRIPEGISIVQICDDGDWAIVLTSATFKAYRGCPRVIDPDEMRKREPADEDLVAFRATIASMIAEVTKEPSKMFPATWLLLGTWDVFFQDRSQVVTGDDEDEEE